MSKTLLGEPPCLFGAGFYTVVLRQYRDLIESGVSLFFIGVVLYFTRVKILLKNWCNEQKNILCACICTCIF
jgi:hypothetical protein